MAPMLTVAQKAQAPLGVVGREDGDPVAVLDAELAPQRVRRRELARPDELGEPDSPVAVDEERLRRRPGPAAISATWPQRPHPLLVDLHLDAVRPSR